MKTIYIFDYTCPQPYTTRTLQDAALGGTEATVARVAAELACTNLVCLFQRGRLEHESDKVGTLTYFPQDHEAALSPPDATITLRDAKHYADHRARYPRSANYLWLHDIIAGEYKEHLQSYLQGQPPAHLICVSQYHTQQVFSHLGPNHHYHTIYNPLAEYCRREIMPYDRHKLVYFSSPHKGLEYALKLFTQLRSAVPLFTLTLANPGYLKDLAKLPDGVINLGALPHKQVIEQVRTALCTFYPNIGFPETFGLVMAESNAVGTPVLAHDIGAAREILAMNPTQIIDCTKEALVLERVIKWSNGERPVVRLNPAFRMSEVVKTWRALLTSK